MDTSIELDFGDGRYRFWLAMPQILAIEKGERSIMEIWSDLGDALNAIDRDGELTPIFVGGGAGRMREIVDVIKFGLIGGGSGFVNGAEIEVSPITATRIIETYVHNRPIAETLPVAWAILQAAIFGVRLKKKAEPETVKRPHSKKARSSRTAASSA